MSGELKDLVGKELIKAFTMTGKSLEAAYPNCIDNGEVNYALHVFETRCGQVVHVLGGHHHNGYYSGGSVMGYKIKVMPKPVQNTQARLVLVVGLPASGKTTFTDRNYATPEWIILDDEMFSTPHELVLASLLNRGSKVVLCDPRLCLLDCFSSVHALALTHVESRSQIEVVYFDNNKERDIQYFHTKYDKTIDYIESLEGAIKRSLIHFI